MSAIISIAYIISAILFIIGLKMLGSPATARKGNMTSAIGMLLAVLVTLISKDIVDYKYIIIGVAIGTLIGILASKLVAMTSMPEMVALFNGFGGIASLLVGWAEFTSNSALTTSVLLPTYIAVIIGGITFTGSLIAYAKLSEKISSAPFLFTGQNIVNGLIVFSILALGAIFAGQLNIIPVDPMTIFIIATAIAIVFGIMVVIPIGGADMPVVISLLNSYSGLAACAAGFVIGNTVLIVAGSLVGASGLILTNIMCKAMNRSLSNVLFSGFGSAPGATAASDGPQGEVKPLTADDAYYILEAATSVVFVPGYGLAVAQAQHVARELGEILEENGCEVKYAVHPVAGRMPGHMNVLLAEANVPYEQLVEMDDINRTIESVDICIVVGANDVVNPSAREDENSTIYGMPIINVDLAKTVFVLKRSMAAGFAGIQNPLFFKDNTRMLFGDAKATIVNLIAQFKN